MGVLDGKVAIVTGGTSGIGARAAELFVEEGARVVVSGRRRAPGEALAARLGERASFVAADVAKAAEVRALVEGTAARCGRLDVLFNNAGYDVPLRGIADFDADEHDRLMAVLVRGVALGMKYAAPIMLRQGSGSIINTGSIAAVRTGCGSVSYSLAKAAVLHLSRLAAVELGEHGVRVNSLSPGAILTGIFGKEAGLDPETADREADALSETFAGLQPIPRAGLPEDIARGALFLASDASSFVNGADLLIDGGLIAGTRFSEAAAGNEKFYRVLRAAAPRAG
jgi:NAD(P)-dependent dehydrogenase (short-subunit alcohol dehydrogenase family)